MSNFIDTVVCIDNRLFYGNLRFKVNRIIISIPSEIVDKVDLSREIIDGIDEDGDFFKLRGCHKEFLIPRQKQYKKFSKAFINYKEKNPMFFMKIKK